MIRFIKRLIGALWLGFVLIGLSVIVINVYILGYSNYEIEQVDFFETGMILGASVNPDGTLSPALQVRVDAAVQQRNAGHIEKIFVSGDDHDDYYKEVTAIVGFLLDAGIPSNDIVMDPYGIDTYDSMWRAYHLFAVDQVVIFTQEFHMPRSLYIARRLGIEAYGFPVDDSKHWGSTSDHIREFFARIKAFLDVEVFESYPAYGDIGPLLLE